jgi:hypothetical protein
VKSEKLTTKIKTYDKNGHVNKGVMSDFVGKMRKFFEQSAQVFKITLKMRVVFSGF